MVYMFINLLVGAALMIFAFASEHVAMSQKGENSITNQILLQSVLFLVMGATMGLSYFAPRFLCLLIGRVGFVLAAWYCTGYCKALLLYKTKKPHRIVTVFQWIFNVLAFVIVFVTGRGVTGISIKETGIFQVSSANLIEGAFGRMINLTWLDAYQIFYFGFLQFLVVLMVLVRAEYLHDKLLKQNMLVIAFGTLCSWILAALLVVGSAYQPALKGIYILALVPELVIFVYSSVNSVIWGKKLVFRTILRIAFVYMIPALLAGLSFFVLFKLFPDRSMTFYVFISIVCLVIFSVWSYISMRFAKKDIMRDGKYATDFEEIITALNFEEKSKEIEKTVVAAFKKYVESSTVRIAIDAGTGFLETAGEDGESEQMCPINQEGFDVLLNIKHSIVFRSFVEKNHQMQEAKTALLKMMDENNVEAFILLNEGRRIVGAIFLGSKTSGDSYNDYDYKIFEKLYSNFFVVGYYMKNMMNESVVGTVNREIRMSSQIITSIQENMDYISNPKVDCGYRMVPAHNIGGEFIDMIRLNDTRHMFVIGALNGKGIAASMSMVILKSVIRTDLAETKDFKLLVEKVNAFIRTGLPKGTFFSGLFGIIDFSTDTLYYINCGAPALFMYNHLYNNVIEIQGEGHVLGFAKDISNLIRVKRVKLTEGDIIFACTDGLIESKSLRGESYGKTRVQSQIMENSSFPAEKMGQFIFGHLQDFVSRALEDDVTMLVIKQMK